MFPVIHHHLLNSREEYASVQYLVIGCHISVMWRWNKLGEKYAQPWATIPFKPGFFFFDVASLQLRTYFTCQFIVTAIALIFHFEKHYHPKVDMCHYKKAIFVGEDILNIFKTFSFFLYFLLWRCSRLCLIILDFVFLVDARKNVFFFFFQFFTGLTTLTNAAWATLGLNLSRPGNLDHPTEF